MVPGIQRNFYFRNERLIFVTIGLTMARSLLTETRCRDLVNSDYATEYYFPIMDRTISDTGFPEFICRINLVFQDQQLSSFLKCCYSLLGQGIILILLYSVTGYLYGKFLSTQDTGWLRRPHARKCSFVQFDIGMDTNVELNFYRKKP